MRYINAKVILPHHLVKELREYVQAGYIYIPARESRHRAQGEQSGCRRELAERNTGIVDVYRQGVSLEELGDKYCLSVHAIRKIVYQKQTMGDRSARLPFLAGLSGVYQADAGAIIQSSTEKNSGLHIRFPGDGIELPEIRKQR